jgi:transposase
MDFYDTMVIRKEVTMEKLTYDDPKVVKLILQQEISRSSEARYDQRLHGLLFLSRGMSTYEVADLLGHSPRTIQYWFHRFQEDGLSGLLDAEGRGRRSSLDAPQRKQLGADLRKPPTVFGYPQGQWDGILLSHHIKRALGLKIGVRQCQRIFHQFGFRRRKPRGVIAGANPEEQATYKKTAPVSGKKRS